jgi:hypothetical protein
MVFGWSLVIMKLLSPVVIKNLLKLLFGPLSLSQICTHIELMVPWVNPYVICLPVSALVVKLIQISVSCPGVTRKFFFHAKKSLPQVSSQNLKSTSWISAFADGIHNIIHSTSNHNDNFLYILLF